MFLTDEKGTMSSMQGLAETIERRGLFGVAVHRPRLALLPDAAQRGQGGQAAPDPGGAGAGAAGDPAHRVLFARSAGADGAGVRDVAGPGSAGASTARAWHDGCGERVFARRVHAGLQRALRRGAGRGRTAFIAYVGAALEDTLCVQDERQVGRDNCIAWRGKSLQSRNRRIAITMSVRRSGCTNTPTAAWRCSTARAAWPVTRPMPP